MKALLRKAGRNLTVEGHCDVVGRTRLFDMVKLAPVVTNVDVSSMAFYPLKLTLSDCPKKNLG